MDPPPIAKLGLGLPLTEFYPTFFEADRCLSMMFKRHICQNIVVLQEISV